MNVNTAMTAGHLTEDQIDDALMGVLGADAAGHLAACDGCTARLTEAQLPLTSFKAMSTAWSERRSATLPQPVLSHAARPGRMAWGAAVASAMLAIAVAVPVVQRHANGAGSVAAMASVTPVATEVAATEVAASDARSDDEQITQDNQMLKAIDHELDASAEDPEMLGLQAAPARGRNATTSVRD